VGGQSLVFTRYHEARVTRIRSHRYSRPRLYKHIVDYDANAPYLSTMLREMPCGKEKVVHYDYPAKAAPAFTECMKAGTWFGFAEVDTEIPKKLWMKFQEVRPFSSPNRFPTKRYPNT